MASGGHSACGLIIIIGLGIFFGAFLVALF